MRHPDLIPTHEGAVARNIGGKNCRELPFDGVRFQPRHLPNPEYRPTGCEIREVLSHSETRWQAISDSDEFSTVSTKSCVQARPGFFRDLLAD